MGPRPERSDPPAGSAGSDQAPGGPDPETVRAGEELLRAGDEAIRRALSGDSQAFLRANRQSGGE